MRLKDYFGRFVPPPWSRAYDPIAVAHSNRLAEMDLRFRQKRSDSERLFAAQWLVCTQDGSGFPMSELLRNYYIEYTDRLLNHGPYSQPTSFNVVAAFLAMTSDLPVFDLLQESEHALSLPDYIDWYTSESLATKKTSILLSALIERTIYEYNFTTDPSAFSVETKSKLTKLSVLGINLVREGNELSCMLLAGESPARPSDQEILSAPRNEKVNPWKKDLEPSPRFSLVDRYIPEFPDLCRIILLCRFNLPAETYDVRYVNVDLGSSFLVYTDENSIFSPNMTKQDVEDYRKVALRQLDEYSPLFSIASSLLFLPVYFIDKADRVNEVSFLTKLEVERNEPCKRKALRVLGPGCKQFRRTVRFASPSLGSDEFQPQIVNTPDLEFQTSGFWRPLSPGEIGEDKNGDPIVGRTWVERYETWSAKKPSTFSLLKEPRVLEGTDPGFIYVIRSPSHARDVFKVGLTRVGPSKNRASEISRATGVPIEFTVLTEWFAPDCGTVEKEVHKRLEAFRLNKRREFFRCQLGLIISTVSEVISDLQRTVSSREAPR